MDSTARNAANYAALSLLAVCLTQIAYIAMRKFGIEFDSRIIWTIEAVAFLGISVAALVAMWGRIGSPMGWAAISVGGMLNVIQVGMGLAMFKPVSDAGAAMAPVFQSIMAGAFFLYFAGKFLFGFAAILFGVGLFESDRALGKGVGALAILAGLASMSLNLAAMAKGIDGVFPAGAAGTAATLLLVIAVFLMARRPSA